MPKFSVTVRAVQRLVETTTIEIEAETEEQARIKAVDMAGEDSCDFTWDDEVLEGTDFEALPEDCREIA